MGPLRERGGEDRGEGDERGKGKMREIMVERRGWVRSGKKSAGEGILCLFVTYN
jgi:hypothetical protein